MVAITRRADLTRGLTNAEIDANWDSVVADLNTKVTAAGARAAISVTGSLTYNPTTGVLGFTETPLTSANIVTALGFTPYNAANPAGYITASASITGNSATATALQTARTINGVSFNGSANITITAAASDVYSWAKASTKPSYTYSEVGAAAATHYHDRIYNGANGSSNYLLLSSGNELEFFDSAGTLQPLYLQYSGASDSLRGPGGNVVLHAGNYSSYAAPASHSHSYLPLSGGTLSGNLTVPQIYSNDWFRSNGASGWYNQTYGGGIWMNDASWVRVYGSKSFLTDWHQLHGGGNIWTSSYGWLHDRFTQKGVGLENCAGQSANVGGYVVSLVRSGLNISVALANTNCNCNCSNF